MKTVRIILCMLLTVAVVSAALLLASCGSEPEKAADAAESSEATEDADITGADDAQSSSETGAETEAATAGSETETEATPAGSEAETEPGATGEPYENPLEGFETVSEELEIDEENGMSMAEYRLLKRMLFTTGEKEYTWFEFYNACVSGELRLTDPDVAEYLNECSGIFAENGFENEAAQANAILEAMKGLN